LREDGPFAPARAVHIARQVGQSLREAHSLLLVHRDVKPSNIILLEHADEADFVKLIDFGLVRHLMDGPDADELEGSGKVLGSPRYMSPEHIQGGRVDARSDQYSLGVTLYEMLTGMVPFPGGKRRDDVMRGHVLKQVPLMREMNPSVEVPSEVEEIIMRALEKRPEDRFASMEELLSNLRCAATNLGDPTPDRRLSTRDIQRRPVTGVMAGSREGKGKREGASEHSRGLTNEIDVQV